MEHHILVEQVETFILRGNLDDAMDLVVEHIKNRDTIALCGRLKELNRESTRGVLSKEDRAIRRNEISDSLLAYCHRLKNGSRHSKNGVSEEEPLGKGDDGDVLTDVKTLEIEIRINRDFSTYSTADQEKLLEAIKNLLEINGDINIKRMREGSVLLTLELTPEQCERLHWAIQSGQLEEFDVVDSEINNKSHTSSKHDIISRKNQIKDLIANSKTGEALERLSAYTKQNFPELLNSSILLQSSWQNLMERRTMLIVDDLEYTKEFTRITTRVMALLATIDNMKDV